MIASSRTLPKVKRIFLTGKSGTGTLSVIRELVARGYVAVDTDDGWWDDTEERIALAEPTWQTKTRRFLGVTSHGSPLGRD